MTTGFAVRVAALQREVDSNLDAVYHLRELEESWARHLLELEATGDIASQMHTRVKREVDPTAGAEALVHLEAAEGWQWRIGSYATGSGEGLASMAEVHALQMARAWIAAALFRQSHDVTLRDLASTLVTAVERAHNRMGEKHVKAIRQLRALLEP